MNWTHAFPINLNETSAQALSESANNLHPYNYKHTGGYVTLIFFSVIICGVTFFDKYMRRFHSDTYHHQIQIQKFRLFYFLEHHKMAHELTIGDVKIRTTRDEIKLVETERKEDLESVTVVPLEIGYTIIENHVEPTANLEIASSNPPKISNNSSGVSQSSTNSNATSTKPVEDWGKLEALSFPRFVAAAHIIGFHFVQFHPRPVPNLYVMEWGFTWVPWFMMLSGFILTYSTIAKAAKQNCDEIYMLQTWNRFDFLKKRLMGIYPVYLIGLAIACGIAVRENTWQETELLTFIAEMTLTQTWFPRATEYALQTQCWFLSAIIPLWLIHGEIMSVLSKMSLTDLWKVMTVLASIPWLLVIIPAAAGYSENWYNQHAWGSTDSGIDIAVIMLKFHPLSFVHVYSFGVALAYVFKHVRSQPPVILKYGGSIGYLGLALIFTIPALSPPGYKLSTQLGVLAPLQGIIIIGLAIGQDCVANVFSWWPLQVLGEYSYAVYVLQFVCYAVWQEYADVGFFFFLFACSIVVQTCGDRIGKNPQSFTKAMQLVACATFLALVVYGSLPQDTINAAIEAHNQNSHEAGSQSYVRYSSTSFDTQLHLYSSDAFDDISGSYDFINPSLLYANDTLFVAARRHRKDTKTTTYKGKVLTQTIWHSDIAFGVLNKDSFEPLSALRKVDVALASNLTNDWYPCVQEPIYQPCNDSFVQLVVTGPQDPRLLVHDNSLLMTFFSTFPGGTPLSFCPQTGLNGTVYLTDSLESLIHVATVRLASNALIPPYVSQSTEKNWISIPAPSESDLFFLRHLSPLDIVQPLTNQRDKVVIPTVAWLANSVSLDEAATTAAVQVHGGANAVFVNWDTEAGDDYFLAVFHTVDGSNTYTNYMAKIVPVPNYQVVAVSKPLPLISSSSACVTFASGLTVIDQLVIISYGSCDAESRVLVLGIQDLRKLFS